jgi:hypothetical protein
MADKSIHSNYIAPVIVGLIVSVASAGVLAYMKLGDKPERASDEPSKVAPVDRDGPARVEVATTTRTTPSTRKAILLKAPDSITIERNKSAFVRLQITRVGFEGELAVTPSYPLGMFSASNWLIRKATALLPTNAARGQQEVLVKLYAGDKPGTYAVTLHAATKKGAEQELSAATSVRVIVR